MLALIFALMFHTTTLQTLRPVAHPLPGRVGVIVRATR
jgi:hypothetical protein